MNAENDKNNDDHLMETATKKQVRIAKRKMTELEEGRLTYRKQARRESNVTSNNTKEGENT